jgi:hypothetical protein
MISTEMWCLIAASNVNSLAESHVGSVTPPLCRRDDPVRTPFFLRRAVGFSPVQPNFQIGRLLQLRVVHAVIYFQMIQEI